MKLKKNIIVLLLILFGGITGTKSLLPWVDSIGYENYFELAITNGYLDIITERDFLFIFLLKFLNDLGISFSLAFWMISIFTTTTLASYGVKRSGNYLFLILYFTLIYWLHNYIQVRMALGLSFFVIAYDLHEKKSPLSFFMLLIAIFIHDSMIILFSLFLLTSLISKKRKFLIILLFIPFMALIRINIFHIIGIVNNSQVNTYLNLYREGFYTEYSHFPPTVFIIMIYVIYLSFMKKFHTETNSIEYKLSLLSPMIYYLFGFLPVMAIRLQELLTFFFLISISRCLKKDFFIKILATTFTLLGLKNFLNVFELI